MENYFTDDYVEISDEFIDRIQDLPEDDIKIAMTTLFITNDPSYGTNLYQDFNGKIIEIYENDNIGSWVLKIEDKEFAVNEDSFDQIYDYFSQDSDNFPKYLLDNNYQRLSAISYEKIQNESLSQRIEEANINIEDNYRESMEEYKMDDEYFNEINAYEGF